MSNKLDVGSYVRVTLKNGETYEGRIKVRSGIGELDNFSPKNEEIVLQRDNGDKVSFLYSSICNIE